MKRNPKIAVIGAGVIGLTSATLIQKEWPDAQVTVFADKFLTETTSDGAAGLFRPGVSFSGPNEEITKKWLKDSYNFFSKILSKESDEAEKAGIFNIRVYFLSSKYPEAVKNHFMEELMPDFRKCNENELNLYGHDEKYGNTCTTFVIECRKYLPYLMQKFEGNGGGIIKRTIESFEELANDFDVVINCSGLGSKHLCPDKSMTSIKGQVFKVDAPWIKHAVYEDYDTYIIPGTKLVTLGGTKQFGSLDTTLNKYDSDSIWNRCLALIPSLRNARVEREWVGQRPYRPYVRVERETKELQSGKTLEIVHNYGHGGYGVMTSPGTSMHAVELLKEFLKEHQLKRSKL